MTTFELCDGSTVEYEPKYAENWCDECGHELDRTVSNEPNFHGKRVWRDGSLFCERCGVEFGGIEKINQICVENMLPSISKQIEESNKLFMHYKKGR